LPPLCFDNLNAYVIIIYAEVFIKYFFFGGGMWESLAYILMGNFVIALYGLSAVLITSSYSIVARLSSPGAGRFISLIIIVLLTVILEISFLLRSSTSWIIPTFLLLFGIYGFWLGRTDRLTDIISQQLIDGGLVVVLILVGAKVSDYVISGYDAWDWLLLFCALLYAIPLVLVAAIASSFKKTLIWLRLLYALALAAIIMPLSAEPYLPARFFGVVILPYIQRHAMWAYLTWGLAALIAIVGIMNVKSGFTSFLFRSQSIWIEGFIGGFIYSFVNLLVWRYPQERGLQDIVFVMSTLWITVYVGTSTLLHKRLTKQ
jgi:hypothetical protein